MHANILKALLLAALAAALAACGSGLALTTQRTEGYSLKQEQLAQIRPGQSQELALTRRERCAPLVHRRVDGRWEFGKSFYRKLRLPTAWVVMTLRAAGFAAVDTGLDRGLVVVTATK